MGREHRVAAMPIPEAAQPSQSAHGRGTDPDPLYAPQKSECRDRRTLVQIEETGLYTVRGELLPGHEKEKLDPGEKDSKEVRFQNGDYFFPEMGLTEEEQRPVGKYGLMRQEYLQEHRPGLFTHLLLSGKLMEHLHEIDDKTLITALASSSYHHLKMHHPKVMHSSICYLLFSL